MWRNKANILGVEAVCRWRRGVVKFPFSFASSGRSCCRLSSLCSCEDVDRTRTTERSRSFNSEHSHLGSECPKAPRRHPLHRHGRFRMSSLSSPRTSFDTSLQGKTTLMQRLNSYLHSKDTPPYILNLDPAVTHMPYSANIDIRDTVDYKEVMKQCVAQLPCASSHSTDDVWRGWDGGSSCRLQAFKVQSRA